MPDRALSAGPAQGAASAMGGSRLAPPGPGVAPAAGVRDAPLDLLPGRETVYGHRKRVEFIVRCLRQHARVRAAARHGAPEPLRVLDLGCGTGVMLTRPLAGRGFDVTGIDLDEVSIRQARRLNVAPALQNLEYVTGRIEDQPWARGFDAIVCSEVLEHVPDTDGFVQALLRCLRDDGILILTVPNGYGPFEIDSHLWGAVSRLPGFWRLEAAWIKMKQAILSLSGGREAALAAAEIEDRPESLATLNENSPHCQRFTRGRILRLMRRRGLDLVDWGRSAVWSGPIAHTLLRDCSTAVRLNCALADRLPAWMVSGHYFCFRRAKPAG